MKRRVVDNPQLTSEAKVLLVIRKEADLYAGVALNVEGIDDVETIETDSIPTYWRGKGILQQANLIVIYIYFSKDIRCHLGEDITCLNEVIDTCAVFRINIDTFLPRVFTIILMEYLLCCDYWKNILSCDRILLYLLFQPRLSGIRTRVESCLGDIIKSYGKTFVVAILIEVFILKFCLLFLCDNTTHQFYSRILLSGIARTLRLHHNFTKVIGSRLQLYDKIIILVADIYTLCLISYGGEIDIHTLVACNREATPSICDS